MSLDSWTLWNPSFLETFIADFCNIQTAWNNSDLNCTIYFLWFCPFFQIFMGSDFDLLITPYLYSFPSLYKLCALALLVTLLIIHNNSEIYPWPSPCSWVAILPYWTQLVYVSARTLHKDFKLKLSKIKYIFFILWTDPLPRICQCHWCKNTSFHSFSPFL